MNKLFIFYFLFTVSYDKSNNYSYVDLEKVKNTEAVVRMCSAKQVLLKISQNSQEHTYVGVSFLINFCYGTILMLLKTESLFLDSLYSSSSFPLWIVVFTYLSSNILLQKIVLDFQ